MTATFETKDDDLRLLARSDRAAALDGVARRYVRGLLSHARSIVHNAEEASDLVQETFIRAMREPRLFDSDFHIQAWLHRVVTNLAFNSDRNRRRRGFLLETRYEAGGTLPSAEGLLAEAQAEQAFRRTLGVLTEAHRRILELRYVEDLSYAEIAVALDVKMGTVMSRLSRAREQFVRNASQRPG